MSLQKEESGFSFLALYHPYPHLEPVRPRKRSIASAPVHHVLTTEPGKGRDMHSYQPFLQNSSRIHHKVRFNTPALFITLLLLLLPSALPATARASGSMVMLTFGCSSPSD